MFLIAGILWAAMLAIMPTLNAVVNFRQQIGPKVNVMYLDKMY